MNQSVQKGTRSLKSGQIRRNPRIQTALSTRGIKTLCIKLIRGPIPRPSMRRSIPFQNTQDRLNTPKTRDSTANPVNKCCPDKQWGFYTSFLKCSLSVDLPDFPGKSTLSHLVVNEFSSFLNNIWEAQYVAKSRRVR